MIKNFKEYQEKKNKLFEYNKFYYDKNSPKVDDATYDRLKKQLIFYEKNNQISEKEKKVSDTIGFSPSKKFSKIKHAESMLSLENAFDQEDSIEFYKKIKNYLNFNFIQYK